MYRNSIFWIAGLALLVLGLFLPRDWYDALPNAGGSGAFPLKGVTLLQISLVIEGLALLWLARTRCRYSRLSPEHRLPFVAGSNEQRSQPVRHLSWLLVGVTAVAVILRWYRLDADLWLDEIVTVGISRDSVFNLMASYISTNNHLLNTLLVKVSVALFGESEWAVRLPAAIFGMATVPALYWVTKMALSRWAGIAAALLLAVSYHHIFFSQNARGYAAYLFLSLVATGLFVRGMQDDRPRTWALYILAMFLNFAALLNAMFVLAAHIVTGAVVLLVMRRQGYPVLPLFKRLFSVFAATGFLAFQLYAVIIPQVLAYVDKVYTVKAAGFAPLSVELFLELVRGVAAGFGPGVLLGAVPFVAIAGAGYFTLARRNWVLALALLLPAFITGVYVLARGLAFSPRLMLFGLLLAIMSAVAGLIACTNYLARLLNKGPQFSRRLQSVLVALVCIVSVSALPRYYAVPKQKYRAAIEYTESLRQSGQVVVAIHLTEVGIRYYSQIIEAAANRKYFYVRSLDRFDEVVEQYAQKDVILMTTFHRALRLEYPELQERIEQGWKVDREFPATIGDGGIAVWSSRR
ncbi:MAG: hypothetical protein HKO55_02065 [Gammaproteobacteria bacterium]|nr:hypothetical protein [Gammaproteobacteria bacterium]